mmetsp:Transcript_97152/g.302489  ORF Transcript_97152/g.302489 Transcript_97152/m.302489 type:complete len:219 (-) Transcript_97152:200-856(-)
MLVDALAPLREGHGYRVRAQVLGVEGCVPKGLTELVEQLDLAGVHRERGEEGPVELPGLLGQPVPEVVGRSALELGPAGLHGQQPPDEALVVPRCQRVEGRPQHLDCRRRLEEGPRHAHLADAKPAAAALHAELLGAWPRLQRLHFEDLVGRLAASPTAELGPTEHVEALPAHLDRVPCHVQGELRAPCVIWARGVLDDGARLPRPPAAQATLLADLR